ncbi:RloB family protein [Segatella salivae]|uniref:RloB family protein n=1 Tax=Segatella salivae TaxID=228604 RepID=UPI001CB5AC5F|nr:RloB family protein [Segatella salivae]MBF1560787.1 RloB domain-containing protein [Segatella salivae]
MKKTTKKRGPLVNSERKQGTRAQIVRFLIVCEGEKTEPNYFKAFIDNRRSEVKEVNVKGCGCSTCQLINEAKKIQEKLEHERQVPFDRVWLVFDKDEFKDFNTAIADAKKEGMNCAWSNQAFELWYVLHFQYLDTGVDRKQYIGMIEDKVMKASKSKTFKYKKNDVGFYQILHEHGNEDFAFKNAEKLRNRHKGKVDYAAHNPRTEVDLLVDELRHPEKALDKIEEAEKACEE